MGGSRLSGDTVRQKHSPLREQSRSAASKLEQKRSIRISADGERVVDLNNHDLCQNHVDIKIHNDVQILPRPTEM